MKFIRIKQDKSFEEFNCIMISNFMVKNKFKEVIHQRPINIRQRIVIQSLAKNILELPAGTVDDERASVLCFKSISRSSRDTIHNSESSMARQRMGAIGGGALVCRSHAIIGNNSVTAASQPAPSTSLVAARLLLPSLLSSITCSHHLFSLFLLYTYDHFPGISFRSRSCLAKLNSRLEPSLSLSPSLSSQDEISFPLPRPRLTFSFPSLRPGNCAREATCILPSTRCRAHKVAHCQEI